MGLASDIEALQFSSLRRWQPKRRQNPLEVVIAIIFDFDPAALFPVMDRDMSSEFFLQPILHIFHYGRRHLNRVTFAPATANSQLARNQSLRGTNRRAATQNRFRDQQLIGGRFQRKQYFGVADRQK